MKKLLLVACSTAIAALPLFGAAAPARRHSATTPYDVTITGVAVDAATQKPVVNALISVENFKTRATTDSQGKYTLIAKVGGLPVHMSAARSGYSSATQTVTATSTTDATTLNFSLQSTPTATIKDTQGNTAVVDAESFKFAYLITFSGYSSSDTANFCLADGTASHPDRSEISKIVGPATPQSNAKCCNLGQVLSIQVTYKNGQTSSAFLTDSCFGSEADVLARDHVTGQFVYFNLVNVAEVNLP